jgi:Ca2+-binding EF-hand superfamily protein
LAELKSKYQAAKHPRTLAREKKEAVVMQEFCDCIQLHSEDGYITIEGFCNYYLDYNCVLPIEKELYFVNTVNNVWGIGTDKTLVAVSRVGKLEDLIFEKIRQRTHGTEDEGKTVRRYFKHFDLKGFMTYDDFKAAIDAIGCSQSDVDLQALFQKYNTEGRFNYDQFAQMILNKGTGNNPNVNPVFGLHSDNPKSIMDNIAKQLLSRGIYGIRSLVKLFRQFDKNNDHKLDRHEIQHILKLNGQTLAPSEFERIFRHFDKNNDGTINVSEFIRGLRGEMNGARIAVVNRAWAKVAPFAETSSEHLAAQFDVSSSPSFKSGQMSRQEVIAELLD